MKNLFIQESTLYALIYPVYSLKYPSPIVEMYYHWFAFPIDLVKT